MLTLSEREMEALNEARERLVTLEIEMVDGLNRLHGLRDLQRRVLVSIESIWRQISERNATTS